MKKHIAPARIQHSKVFLKCLLLGTLTAVVPLQAQVKVESRVVAPIGAASYHVSPQGSRVAAVVMRGSGQAVVVDGVEGPTFDRIVAHGGNQDALTQAMSLTGGAATSGFVLFNPDGSRFAYAAIQGSDVVVLLDGKEIYRAPNHLYALGGMAKIGLTFSPGGKNFYFAAGRSPTEAGLQSLIMNGQAGPQFSYQNAPVAVFSADDTRHAYVAFPPGTLKETMLVVDGKKAAYAGTAPRFTADGKLLITIGQTPQGESVLFDGKPGLVAAGIKQVIPAPVGRGIAAIVQTGPALADTILWLNGKNIPGTEGAREMYFSPDGKRWATWCDSRGTGGPQWMVIDGVRGGNFQAIDGSPVGWKPTFTEDGSKLVYVAQNAGRRFVIVNKEESPDFTLPKPVLSSVGGTVAYLDQKVVGVGGKIFNTDSFGAARGVVDGSFALSEDGKRFGLAASRGSKSVLVIDGVVVPKIQPASVKSSGDPREVARYVRFSPDGKRFAVFGEEPTTRARAIYVDGKVVHAIPKGEIQPDRMDFTLDGQQLYWRGVTKGTGPRPEYTVFFNGQECLRYDRDDRLSQALQSKVASWQMGADGKLRILAVTPEGVVRHTLTPPKGGALSNWFSGAAQTALKTNTATEPFSIAAMTAPAADPGSGSAQRAFVVE